MKISKSNNFKLLFNLHIYGGLFSALYLFIVGLSALNFQHHFLSEEPKDTVFYTRVINYDHSLKNDSLARFITQELKIKGHIPPWEMRSDDSGKFSFKIQRPARTYDISLNRNNTNVSVKEIHYRAGRILRAMHFGSIAGLDDPALKVWSWFTQLSTIIAFLTVSTSVYFWFKKSVKSRYQAGLILGSGLLSLLFILYVWLVG